MSNPFSTKNWTPGAVPFRFAEPDVSGDGIADLFERHRCGQIVGPHGSGKSTLVESLKMIFQKRGYTVHHIMLTDRNRRLPDRFRSDKPDIPSVRIVDGFEQLSWRNRFRLLWTARDGLLIVTHRPVLLMSKIVNYFHDTHQRERSDHPAGYHNGAEAPIGWRLSCPVFRIPVLYRTVPRWDVFRELVRSFSDHGDEAELRRVFDESEGNFRNAFLRLYDSFEIQNGYCGASDKKGDTDDQSHTP